MFLLEIGHFLVAFAMLQNATIRFIWPVVRLYIRPQATPRAPLAKFYIAGFLNPVEKKNRLKSDRNERHFKGSHVYIYDCIWLPELPWLPSKMNRF